MTAASEDPQSTVPDTPAEAEWPPREWREARRGAGAKSMYRTLVLIAVIMAVLVALSFWGMANG
ncbi:hypothetical protein GCM10009839_26880 [Catenulispora yoronensis]|uniref:Uncharacterized protein n=1 Tax=Catenulispora yoronensis TaxID=450799 RepID=A0ABN2U233_9ACTN